jgi:hypothetical protein
MRSNSTTTKQPTATKPRRKPLWYQNAEHLGFTIEIESQEHQTLLTSRLLAMAEYLMTTPAKAMLAERLYIACAAAWKHNRQNKTTGRAEFSLLEEETLKRNTAIMRAIDFVDGNREDADMNEEVRHLRLQLCVPGTNSGVVDIYEWKRQRNWYEVHQES